MDVVANGAQQLQFLRNHLSVMHNDLGHGCHQPALFTGFKLVQAAQGVRPRIAELPRPRIAILVGGDSGQFVFTAPKGRRLVELADQLARGCGGSLLYTDSPVSNTHLRAHET